MNRSDQPPGGREHRRAVRAELLRFLAGARHPLGFGWLRADGALDPERPVALWITGRMTHVAALGALAAEPPGPSGPDVERLQELAAHGVEALCGPLYDQEYGGWFASRSATGPVETAKQAYAHAFVILAASSASRAGVPGADALLDHALTTSRERFWEEAEGLVVDDWDRTWSRLDDYRGLNANMHTVEAYLAAADTTGERQWAERASLIGRRVIGWAEQRQWRIPEHFDPSWSPLPDYHRGSPADPFRPYGATVGHGLEWSRLLVSTGAALGELEPSAGDPWSAAAVALYDRAVNDGWAVDGEEGFVYTTDWTGQPVVRDRLHWVVAEAVNAATVLHRITGDARYVTDGAVWWDYADRCLLDRHRGSWHHELDPLNRPAGTLWPGKPDVYHAYQAALLPDLPLASSFSTALVERADGDEA